MAKDSGLTTGCSFCKGQGHTWQVEDDKRICFNCLRSQRELGFAEVARLQLLILNAVRLLTAEER